MMRISGQVLQENQDKPVDSLGGAAPVANERNDQETKKKMRLLVRITFTDADQKKKTLAVSGRHLMNSNPANINIFSSSRIYNGSKEKLLRQKELLELQPVRLKREQRVTRAQHGSRDSLFHN